MAAEPLKVVILVSVNIKCHSLTNTLNLKSQENEELKAVLHAYLMTTYS